MPTYIEKEALFKTLSEEAAFKIRNSDGSKFDVGRTNGIIVARDIANNQPVVDITQVSMGRIELKTSPVWYNQFVVEDGQIVDKGRYYDDEIPYCSVCGRRMDGRFMNYCDNCGVKLEAKIEVN